MKLEKLCNLNDILNEKVTEYEINVILDKRRKLIDLDENLIYLEESLYGVSQNTKDFIHKFCKYAQINLKLGVFDSILYLIFNYTDLDINNFKHLHIDKQYIHCQEISNDFKYKFINQNEAIKWIVSYRLTKYYLRRKVLLNG